MSVQDNPHKGKTGLNRLWHATLNSAAGFRAAFRDESAFRQEVALAIVLVPVALWLPGVSIVERLLLIGAVILLMIVELLNSAVEAAIDRIGMELHPLSKKAKDIASAAVFLACLWLGLLWGFIALPRIWNAL
jgi:diacylglycerol kinase (ATP)